jgi:AmmeMemoRadiSam system protein A
MSSTEEPQGFSPDERNLLLDIALGSIRSGLESDRPLSVTTAACPDSLSDKRASFVTLNAGDMLRGCIGSLEPHTSLAEDVSHNAWAAAFRDPRFNPLQTGELARLAIQISVLSTPEIIDIDSEQALIEKIRPGIDGLILQEGSSRATFLPAVWHSLPEPERFLAHLKLKAGLEAGYWSDSIQAWRYTTESFSASVATLEKNNRDYLKEILT